MLNYPHIDPVLLSIGPVNLHWYGFMYLVGFVGGWWLGRLRADAPGSGWRREQIDDLLFYMVLGIVLGGRLGYLFFYGFHDLLRNPLVIFRVWEGGMSFHGGLLGVLAAMWIYGRKSGRSFFALTDFVAPLAPIGLGAGRLGNFINGELWGSETTLPWGMRVPCDRFRQLCVDKLGLPPGSEMTPPLHPTQLYESALEGLVLFFVLWLYSSRPRPVMAVSGLFLLAYGVFRFLVEFARMPDAHIGYLAFGWLTMGQLLTLPMLIGGLFLMWAAYRRERSD